MRACSPILALSLASCLSVFEGEPLEQQRYVLDVRRGDTAPAAEQGTLLVARFHASTTASGRGFLYRRGPHEVEVDFYNELLVPPPIAVIRPRTVAPKISKSRSSLMANTAVTANATVAAIEISSLNELHCIRGPQQKAPIRSRALPD